MDRTQATKIYNILTTLNSTLVHNQSQSYINDSSWNRFNSTVAELAEAYKDDVFKDYIVEVKHNSHLGQFVQTEEFKRKVYAATSYLHQQYLGDFTVPPERNNATSSVPGTVVTQTQTAQQQTDVNVEFNVTLVQLSELLTKAEAQFPDENSNENKFIKRLKQALPFAKSSVEILAAVLKTANEFGVSPADLLKMLGLGH